MQFDAVEMPIDPESLPEVHQCDPVDDDHAVSQQLLDALFFSDEMTKRPDTGLELEAVHLHVGL